ncbi:MAG: DNA repair protein RadC [Thermodesulfobacteriota bacterium]
MGKTREGSGKAKESPHAGHRKRLRDKFIASGLASLHDYEAVELLLTYALPRRDVKPLAKALINRFKGLRGIFDAHPEELQGVNGISEQTVALIKLVKELNSAYLEEKIKGTDVVSKPEDVIDYLSHTLSGEKIEKFMALYLNSKNEVMGIETLHEVTLNQTAVYPRTVLEQAFKHNARSIIFVHNHPSGDATPSKKDIKLTNDLEKAAKSVDILVHDHLIIGKNRHYSIRDGNWFEHKRASQ